MVMNLCQVQGASTENSKHYLWLDTFYWGHTKSQRKGKMRIAWKNKNKRLRIAVLDSSQSFSPAPPGPTSGTFLQEPGPVNYEPSLGSYNFPSSELQLFCYLLQLRSFSFGVSNQSFSGAVIISLTHRCPRAEMSVTEMCSYTVPSPPA